MRLIKPARAIAGADFGVGRNVADGNERMIDGVAMLFPAHFGYWLVVMVTEAGDAVNNTAGIFNILDVQLLLQGLGDLAQHKDVIAQQGLFDVGGVLILQRQSRAHLNDGALLDLLGAEQATAFMAGVLEVQAVQTGHQDRLNGLGGGLARCLGR